MMPTLVPRDPRCTVCKSVAKVEDVTVRLFDADGRRLPPKEAVSYLRSIGISGTERSLYQRAQSHAKHVEKSLAGPGHIAPLTKVAPPAPIGGSPAWLSVNEAAIDTGLDALGLLQARLGTMEDRELIAVAKLGQAASSKRGDWEAKGRQLNQMDALIRLAAGLAE